MGGDNDTVVGGTLPQRITSCLAALDTFLCHQAVPWAKTGVVSSYVPADKIVKVSYEQLFRLFRLCVCLVRLLLSRFLFPRLDTV